MKKIVVYHDNCHDGITALWCALQSREWRDAEHYPARYELPPDLDRLTGAKVLIVDFSWKRPAMADVLAVVESLTLLDHHKSAAEELVGFENDLFAPNRLRMVIDMNRSGAGLAWDELIGGPRPPLVSYVEDRDLWRFNLECCREVHAAVNSYPLTIEQRNYLMRCDIEMLAVEGGAILRYHDKIVQSAAKHALRENIAGHDVPSVACPTIEIVSDLGHAICKGEPFAAIWVDRADGTRSYSLRSDAEGLDVSEIAKTFGGGGHKHAAGFVRGPR